MSAASISQPVPIPLLTGKAAKGLPASPNIQPKMRAAIHAMVWEGLTAEAAADRHNISHGPFIRSLSRPSVQSLIRAEVDVLKTSASPLAARRLIELTSQSDNLNVALKAAMYLDSGGRFGGDSQVNVQVNVQQPGYVIALEPEHLRQIEAQQQTGRLHTVDAKPLTDKG